jgi:hypothetical protein
MIDTGYWYYPYYGMYEIRVDQAYSCDEGNEECRFFFLKIFVILDR